MKSISRRGEVMSQLPCVCTVLNCVISWCLQLALALHFNKKDYYAVKTRLMWLSNSFLVFIVYD